MKYTVGVSRTSWEYFDVEADNEDQARDMALDMAFNYSDWPRADAEYEVYDVRSNE